MECIASECENMVPKKKVGGETRLQTIEAGPTHTGGRGCGCVGSDVDSMVVKAYESCRFMKIWKSERDAVRCR